MLKDKDLDKFIAQLLRYGVVVASSIVVVGGFLYLYNHGQDTIPNYHTFNGEPSDYTTYSGIFRGALTGNAKEIIQLGVLALIATPIMRVFCSLIAFVVERDRLYVVITLIVLVIMLTSIFGGIKL